MQPKLTDCLAPAMTILRTAHLDLEGKRFLQIPRRSHPPPPACASTKPRLGLVLDAQVRSLRDQFVTHHWSQLLYNG